MSPKSNPPTKRPRAASEPTDPSQPVLLQPDNHNKKYEALFLEIDAGQIKLPRFQREFVWDKEQSAKLIDSIRKGIRISKDGKEIDYKDIFIDLDYNPQHDEQIVVTEKVEGRQYESVHDVLSRPLGSFYKKLGHEQADLIQGYRNTLTTYDFSTITIKDYPIEVACEVFSRINTGGKVLTVFEIMVAKTYHEAQGFDLADRYETLRDGSDEEKECLAAGKFETLPASIVMQCVAAITLKAVRSRDILKIKRETFIANWEPMKTSLFMAIDFIRSELRVPVSQLVPYPAAVVPFAYFFHTIGNKKADNAQARLLEQFFYWVGLTERYSSATESKLAEDFIRMDAIAKGKSPIYQRSELSVDANAIQETSFSAGNAYCKAILCLLAYQQPKSFDTNGIVILDNTNLKIATSRNYHHFFPKAYLSAADPKAEPNLIANITLIDGYSNTHRIGKKPPSNYLAKFARTNKSLARTLHTHLIHDMGAYGVRDDDYDKFITRRAKAIAVALNLKLMSMTPAEAVDSERSA